MGYDQQMKCLCFYFYFSNNKQMKVNERRSIDRARNRPRGHLCFDSKSTIVTSLWLAGETGTAECSVSAVLPSEHTKR